jgi:hypothetical protein
MAKSLSILCLFLYLDKLGTQVSLYSEFLKLEAIFFLIVPLYRGPETWRQANSYNKAGENSQRGF